MDLRSGNPAIKECCERVLAMAPKFAQNFWEHRELLRYDRELRIYHRFGIQHTINYSLALDAGSRFETFVFLHEAVRYSSYLQCAVIWDLDPSLRGSQPDVSTLFVHGVMYSWVYGPDTFKLELYDKGGQLEVVA